MDKPDVPKKRNRSGRKGAAHSIYSFFLQGEGGANDRRRGGIGREKRRRRDRRGGKGQRRKGEIQKEEKRERKDGLYAAPLCPSCAP